MLRLFFALALVLWLSPSAWAQQPPLLPCSSVLCKPPVCPIHLIKTGEKKVGCCVVATCRSTICAKVRCRPAVCARSLVKYGERTVRCCKVALCKAPTDCLYNHAIYTNGKQFPSADSSSCCTCRNAVVTCDTRYACPGAPGIIMPRKR